MASVGMGTIPAGVACPEGLAGGLCEVLIKAINKATINTARRRVIPHKYLLRNFRTVSPNYAVMVREQLMQLVKVIIIRFFSLT